MWQLSEEVMLPHHHQYEGHGCQQVRRALEPHQILAILGNYVLSLIKIPQK